LSYIGEYLHSLDPKGRIAMPSRFREELGDKFIITKGFDDECLYAYSMDEWENIIAKLKTLPTADKDVRAFIRFFAAGAAECEADKQGRILIPQSLREHAGLVKDVFITGAITKVEIWDKDKWKQHNGDFVSNAGKITEKLAALGI